MYLRLGARMAALRSVESRTWAWAGVLVVAFLALEYLSSSFIIPPSRSAVLWLPAGLSLAALVGSSRKHWSPFLLAIFLAEVLAVLLAGYSPIPAVLWGAANAFRAWLGAWLIWRWCGPRVRLTRVRDISGLLLLGGGVGCLMSATIGAAVEALWFNTFPPASIWLSWYLSDALGTILVAPLLLTWWPGSQAPLTRPQRVEMVCALAALALVTEAVFRSWFPREVMSALPYVSIPLIHWLSLRMGPRGASAASLVVGALAVWHTYAGRGPFGGLAASLGVRILSIQAFLAVVSVTALLLAALAAGRRQAERVQWLLAETSRLLTESPDDRRSLPAVASRISDVLDVGTGIWLVDSDGELERVASARLPPTAEAELLREVRTPPTRSRTWVQGDCAMVRVPLRGHERELGMIALVDPSRGRPFSVGEVRSVEDLAHRSALAVERARLFSEVREAVAVRDEFLAVAAHELNTPLTALKLRLAGMGRHLHHGDAPEKSLQTLRKAEQQTTRLSQLVEELLDVSRIHTGRLTLRREPVELKELVEEVAERFSAQARRAGCPLVLHLEAGATGWYDRRRLEQALLHLLANAAKFGAGQPIDITVECRGDLTRLVIRDRGIGIDAAALERIFERCERAVSVREYGGLGLGLYLTREIAEAHGGRITVSSRRGEGATFVLELPATHRVDGRPVEGASWC